MSPEEAKFSAKYGKVKPGGSDFLRKRLNKGVSISAALEISETNVTPYVKTRHNWARGQF